MTNMTDHDVRKVMKISMAWGRGECVYERQ